VTPASALTTTTGSRASSRSTSATAARKFAGAPTDVPPNFITINGYLL